MASCFYYKGGTMKKVLKVLTVLIVLVVLAGIVLAFIKPDLFLDVLKPLQPLADKLHLTRWSKEINTNFYRFIDRGYFLNLPSFIQSKTAYLITCIIGVIVLIGGGALVMGAETFLRKMQLMGVLCVFFAAIFGLDFVLAVIMINLVIIPFAG